MLMSNQMDSTMNSYQPSLRTSLHQPSLRLVFVVLDMLPVDFDIFVFLETPC